ncbi:hypothetical protein FQA39_LY03586 [Lamprigera yunnana]|nr:hypothetical protein FQA39_LY03586 [Lamprigera yunnana]
MDVDSIESCAIKSEVNLTETFSFCGQYGDYGDKELKTELVEYEESFKCKEEDIFVEQTGMCAAPVQQFSCNECDFMTMEKDSLVEHLKITKNVKYSCCKYECTKCDYKTVWQKSLKEHVKIHTGDKYECKECDYKTMAKVSKGT